MSTLITGKEIPDSEVLTETRPGTARLYVAGLCNAAHQEAFQVYGPATLGLGQ